VVSLLFHWCWRAPTLSNSLGKPITARKAPRLSAVPSRSSFHNHSDPVSSSFFEHLHFVAWVNSVSTQTDGSNFVSTGGSNLESVEGLAGREKIRGAFF
jgi:hypothetical protein